MINNVITFFVRSSAGSGYQSLEKHTRGVVGAIRLKNRPVRLLTLPYPPGGILNKVLNVLWVRRNRGALNFIMGDVTYASLLLPSDTFVTLFADASPLSRLNFLNRIIYRVFWLRLPRCRSFSNIYISSKTLREISMHLNGHCDYHQKDAIIPCGTSTPVIPEYPYTAAETADLRFLMVGAAANKNVVRVLRALSGLGGELHIVGRVEKGVQELARGLGVRLVTWSNVTDAQLEDLYRASSMLIFPSLYEGFGMPIIEAQAHRLPVITSVIEPMATVCGNGGILVNPYSVKRIREAVCTLLNDKEKRDFVVAEGVTNYKRYEWGRIARQYENITHSFFDRTPAKFDHEK